MIGRTKLVIVVIGLGVAATAMLYAYRTHIPGLKPAITTDMNDVAEPVAAPVIGGTARAAVEIDPRRQQLVGVRTVEAKRQALLQTIRTVGTVRYDETRQADVNVKVEGWVRQLFVNYTGQPVRQGQPLLTLYSPQLLTAENEYLLALRSRDQMQQSQIADARDRADQLVTSALRRLQFWDLPADEIDSLTRNRQPQNAITVPSPAGGFIVDKQVIEGMHVMPGQTLYKIADTSMVWVEADVYESDMPFIRVGQSAVVTLDASSGERYVGRVIYIYPYVDEHTRTNKVRYAFPNSSGRLKPGMYANVELDTGHAEGVVVPANAVLDSGREQVIFVAEGEGRFTPRHVKLGRRSGENVQILDGVKEGEQVASSAAFFLDSESQLRGSLESYASPGQSSGAAPAAPEQQWSITFRTMPDPPKAGENRFEVSVKDLPGRPVEHADVRVQFFMAAMPAMGMPAMQNEVKLSPAGAGVYRGTGQVMTPGQWSATVSVKQAGKEVASKKLTVTAK